MKKVTFWWTAFIFLLTACASTQYYSRIENVEPTIKNEHYAVFLQPRFMDYGLDNSSLRGFILTVVNHTDQDLTIVWKDTRFILDGTDESGFVFSDTNFKFKHRPKDPSVVAPGRRFRDSLFPSGFATYSTVWNHRTLPKGELGIHLAMRVRGEPVSERLTLLHDTNIKK